MDIPNFNFPIFSISDLEKLPDFEKPSNLAKIWIVYEQITDPKGSLSFLKKVMEAVNVDLQNDVTLIVSTPETAFSFARLHRFPDIQQLLLFGVPPKKLGIHHQFALHQPFEVKQCTVLVSSNLEVVQNSQEMKKALWNGLKLVFQGAKS